MTEHDAWHFLLRAKLSLDSVEGGRRFMKSGEFPRHDTPDTEHLFKLERTVTSLQELSVLDNPKRASVVDAYLHLNTMIEDP